MIRDPDEVLYRNGVTTSTDNDKSRWLTREEAVCLLMAWRDQSIPRYNLDFSSRMKHAITSGLENVYLTGLIAELIERVREGKDDPITEVAKYYYMMDNILATSDDDHFITHRFAGYMENAAHDIMMYLKDKEKELNEYERKKFLR